jgi:hypothetical protein
MTCPMFAHYKSQRMSTSIGEEYARRAGEIADRALPAIDERLRRGVPYNIPLQSRSQSRAIFASALFSDNHFGIYKS